MQPLAAIRVYPAGEWWHPLRVPTESEQQKRLRVVQRRTRPENGGIRSVFQQNLFNRSGCVSSSGG
jgi:hypothetical protein